MTNPPESIQELRQLEAKVESFVQNGQADSMFDAHSRSQLEALEALERAEFLDPVKLRTPITL